MTELATKAFGTIEIDPRQIIDFPEGLFGFPDDSSFALLEDREDSPFKWLQSIQNPELAFVVIQPELFLKDPYEPVPSKSDLAALGLDSANDSLIFVIVTIPENDPRKMTANLQGPVLIHKEKKIGRQVISNNDSHSVRVPILDETEV